jgi:Helicase HerA, central domain
MAQYSQQDNLLVLGWQVNPEAHPIYWLNKDATVEIQQDRDLARVSADLMDSHTVIVAQSGSGKSFFLGRLIEELLMRTKCRCLIFDPNGDFSRMDHINEDVWQQRGYDLVSGNGLLTHDTKNAFVTSWGMIHKRVRTRRPPGNSSIAERLDVWWPGLSNDILAAVFDDPIRRSELYHCHEFVKAISELQMVRHKLGRQEGTLIDRAEQIYNTWGDEKNTTDDIEAYLNQEFEIPQAGQVVTIYPIPFVSWSMHKDPVKREQAMNQVKRRAASALRYFPKEIATFYFGKAREYETTDIIAKEPPKSSKELPRLDIVDLASLPDNNTRYLVTNTIIAEESERARQNWWEIMVENMDDTRVPVFVVLEEAHNFIPEEPHNRAQAALRDQFRTIAAEGRKYGLFLILVSQRPDKLDHLILSECANKAIMRLDSRTIVQLVREKLGLQDVDPYLLDKTAQFKKGRVLITGQWTSRPEIFYCAARRTLQGGRDLQKKYWARPNLPMPTSFVQADK